MTTTVETWTGREVRALREAKRMSIRAFASHLGVSERMVSKWEKSGKDITPRPVNQQALDTSLSASGMDVQQRFSRIIGTFNPESRENSEASELELIPEEEQRQVRHPIDVKLMTLVEGGVFLSGEEDTPVYLPDFYIDVFPTTNADYSRFVAATGLPTPQHWEGQRVPDEIYDHPVVFVTWDDATAYSNWAAKTLPTSQQWEKAARGTRGDVYPWAASGPRPSATFGRAESAARHRSAATTAG